MSRIKGKENKKLDERSFNDAVKGDILCINCLLLGYYVNRRQHTLEPSTIEGGGGIKRQSTLTLYYKWQILWRRRQMATKDLILKRK